MGAAQQLPLRLAGAHAAPQEPAGALLLFDLPEDRLDGLPAFGVAGLAVLAFELGGHRRAEPVASGCRGLAVLAGLALAAVPGRRDQQLGRVGDGGDVVDRPVAGVGQRRLGLLFDAGGGQRGGRGLEHGLELVDVVGLVGELGGDDQLVQGGDRLGVVALHGGVAGVQEAAVGVGDVGDGLGVGGLLRAGFERAGCVALALGSSSPRASPNSRSSCWSAAAAWRRISATSASSWSGAVGLVRGVGGQLGPVEGDGADADHAGGGTQPQGLDEEAGERLLVADTEARDSHVVRRLVAGKDPEGEVLCAAAFELPGGAHPQAVAIEEHAEQGLGVVGGVAVPIARSGSCGASGA